MQFIKKLMEPARLKIMWILLMVQSLCLGHATESVLPSIFTPGSAYREYRIVPDRKSDEWRVTDPDSTAEGAREFLPNPVMAFEGVDLKDAFHAELEIDLWNGHPGSINKRLRLNRNEWIPIPERLKGTRGYCGDYMAEYTLSMNVPLEDLRPGRNTIEGASGSNNWGWGQWGWYAIVLRVFLESHQQHNVQVQLNCTSSDDPDSKAFRDNPVFELTIDSETEIQQVDLVAKYTGIDENGDGELSDFHGMLRPEGLTGHVGTLFNQPWAVKWDTNWVPNLKPGAIAFLPRLKFADGTWLVGNIFDGFTLQRENHSIVLIPAESMPTKFWTRNNDWKSCVFDLPQKMFTNDEIVAANLYIRTWNIRNNEQGHTPLKINNSPWLSTLTGPAHAFSSGFFDIPVDELHAGHNLFTFASATSHHGCEILWPGPQLLVRTSTPEHW